MSIRRKNNPDLAEKLLNTVLGYSNMSSKEKEECDLIWEECNYTRFDVLKKVVEICGKVNTPQSRYIKAFAWSANSLLYTKERIEAIKQYLSKRLYYKAYKNNVVTLEKGKKIGKNFHISTFLVYLAEAYYSDKDYEKAEKTYLEIIRLDTGYPIGYFELAEFYKKRKNLLKAITVLEEALKKFNLSSEKEHYNNIERRLKEYRNLEKGIKKHIFVCYDSSPTAFIDGMFKPNIDKAKLELQSEYKNIFERHRRNLEKVEEIEFKYKKNKIAVINNVEYENYLLDDLNIYDKIMEFYIKFNTLGFREKYVYKDNSSFEYKAIKRLIRYYDKSKNYEKAIKVCKFAIEKELYKYSDKMTMQEKINKLSKKAKI